MGIISIPVDWSPVACGCWLVASQVIDMSPGCDRWMTFAGQLSTGLPPDAVEATFNMTLPERRRLWWAVGFTGSGVVDYIQLVRCFKPSYIRLHLGISPLHEKYLIDLQDIDFGSQTTRLKSSFWRLVSVCSAFFRTALRISSSYVVIKRGE